MRKKIALKYKDINMYKIMHHFASPELCVYYEKEYIPQDHDEFKCFILNGCKPVKLSKRNWDDSGFCLKCGEVIEKKDFSIDFAKDSWGSYMNPHASYNREQNWAPMHWNCISQLENEKIQSVAVLEEIMKSEFGNNNWKNKWEENKLITNYFLGKIKKNELTKTEFKYFLNLFWNYKKIFGLDHKNVYERLKLTSIWFFDLFYKYDNTFSEKY